MDGCFYICLLEDASIMELELRPSSAVFGEAFDGVNEQFGRKPSV